MVEKMKATNALVGGEGNGGIIWPRVTFVRDSLSGMALTLALLAERNDSLSRLISNWPRYTFVKSKIAIRPGLAEKVLNHLTELYRSPDAVDVKVDTVDGLRVDFVHSESWLHVRASNTEPIIRILVEARDAAQAERTTTELQELIASI